MSFGETLRELRRQKGFTQESLGERLSLAPQTISKWERGESMPDAGLLPELAKTLGCSLDTLFGMETNSWTDAEKALIRWVKTIPPEDRPRAMMALPAFHRCSLEGVWDDPRTEAAVRETEAYPDYARLAQREDWLFSERRAGKLPYAVSIPDVPAAWEGMADAVSDLTPLWELLADGDGRGALLHILRRQSGEIFVLADAMAELGVEKPETLPKLVKAGLLRPLTLTIDGEATPCAFPSRDRRVLSLLLLMRCLYADGQQSRQIAENPAE